MLYYKLLSKNWSIIYTCLILQNYYNYKLINAKYIKIQF